MRIARLSLGCLVSCVSATAWAQVSVPVDALSVALTARGVSTSASLEGADGRAFELTPARLRSAPVARVGLGGGASTLITTVSGAVEGGGRFTLAHGGDGVWGGIWTSDGAFEIQGVGKLDASGQPMANIVPVAGDLPSCLTERLERVESDHTHVARGGDVSARVLVGFSSNVAALFASEANIAAYAATAVGTLNDGFVNSQMLTQAAELAGYAIVDMPASFGGSETLNLLTGVGEGYADELHELRDAHNADLVPLIIDVPSFCGVAWLAPNDAAYSGFSVTDLDCAIGNLTFAHELGHNFGCSHDPDNAGSGYTPYGFGHRWNGNANRSIMSYSPGVRVPHFSNPDVFAFNGFTGIANARDNARVIDETNPLIASFRSGGVDPTDCDANATPDAVEIADGTAQDENANGVPDSCDIAAGAIDCDGNGFIDEFEISPFVRTTTLPIDPLGEANTVSWLLAGLPPAAGDVTIEVVGYGDFSASDEFVFIEMDAGEWSQSFFISHPGDCYAPRETEVGVIAEATFNALLDGPGIEIDLTGTAPVNPTLCGTETAATIHLTYRTLNAALDMNGDGVLDVCAQTPCYADINTEGTSTGIPDGLVTLSDFSYYLSLWSMSAPAADLTLDNSCDPDIGGGDGVNLSDFSCYLNLWSAGCP